jgi:hypothetical protein
MAGFGRSDIDPGYADRERFSSCLDLCVLDYRFDKEPPRFEVDMTTMPDYSADQAASAPCVPARIVGSTARGSLDEGAMTTNDFGWAGGAGR